MKVKKETPEERQRRHEQTHASITRAASRVGEQLLRESHIVDLQYIQTRVVSAINSTPTGDKRNAFCDANIHLGDAIAALEKAAAL